MRGYMLHQLRTLWLFRWLKLQSKVRAALVAHKKRRFARMSVKEQDEHVNKWLATTWPKMRTTRPRNDSTRNLRCIVDDMDDMYMDPLDLDHEFVQYILGNTPCEP